MMIAVILAALATIPCWASSTFVQVLYLESLRLRTRDLPGAEVLQGNAGREDRAEDGAGRRDVLPDQALAAGLAGDPVLRLVLPTAHPLDRRASCWQTGVAVWLTMVALSFALPQLLYRRTTGRVAAAAASLCCAFWPCWRVPRTASLSFFQSLIDLADDTPAQEEPPTPAENIEALISAGPRKA